MLSSRVLLILGWRSFSVERVMNFESDSMPLRVPFHSAHVADFGKGKLLVKMSMKDVRRLVMWFRRSCNVDRCGNDVSCWDVSGLAIS